MSALSNSYSNNTVAQEASIHTFSRDGNANNHSPYVQINCQPSATSYQQPINETKQCEPMLKGASKQQNHLNVGQNSKPHFFKPQNLLTSPSQNTKYYANEKSKDLFRAYLNVRPHKEEMNDTQLRRLDQITSRCESNNSETNHNFNFDNLSLSFQNQNASLHDVNLHSSKLDFLNSQPIEQHAQKSPNHAPINVDQTINIKTDSKNKDLLSQYISMNQQSHESNLHQSSKEPTKTSTLNNSAISKNCSNNKAELDNNCFNNLIMRQQQMEARDPSLKQNYLKRYSWTRQTDTFYNIFGGRFTEDEDKISNNNQMKDDNNNDGKLSKYEVINELNARKQSDLDSSVDSKAITNISNKSNEWKNAVDTSEEHVHSKNNISCNNKYSEKNENKGSSFDFKNNFNNHHQNKFFTAINPNKHREVYKMQLKHLETSKNNEDSESLPETNQIPLTKEDDSCASTDASSDVSNYNAVRHPTRCQAWMNENKMSKRVLDHISGDDSTKSPRLVQPLYRTINDGKTKKHVSIKLDNNLHEEVSDICNIDDYELSNHINNLESNLNFPSKLDSKFGSTSAPFDTDNWFKQDHQEQTIGYECGESSMDNMDPLQVQSFSVPEKHSNNPYHLQKPKLRTSQHSCMPTVKSEMISVQPPHSFFTETNHSKNQRPKLKLFNKQQPQQTHHQLLNQQGLKRSECNWFRDSQSSGLNKKCMPLTDCRYNFMCKER
ncbi:hypothetical protein HELRODRAFT_160487 [Helobdella robusta]|uniref:Uncharacterized protein n=1 Tax=Helobdella robusta TaxID=6412 RepID=T1EQB1_HELRO|nr:hypothetical protein HELRODRAFT_160487 [Helobdella robusta]ESO06323.1 hypothetical protein HELRODRAFT_160487 [Helobdella robusta]